MTRKGRLAELCVRLADTLDDDMEIATLLQHLVEQCVELFEVAAAGVLLRHQDGTPEAVATSSAVARRLELTQLRLREGPGLVCATQGDQVSASDLAAAPDRWPAYAPAALGEGIAAVDALPLRRREHLLGALELFRSKPGQLSCEDREAAQGLADIATIGLLQHRARASAAILAEQLEMALQSRVVIEQAKGFLAVTGGIELDEAFHRLRDRARSRNQRLSEVSRAVVEREIDPHVLLQEHRR